MKLVGGRLGRGVALALLRDHMDEGRAELAVADIAQHRQQMLEIVPVDRPHIVEAKLLEQRPAGDEAAGQLLGPPGRLEQAAGQVLGELFAALAQAPIGAA